MKNFLFTLLVFSVSGSIALHAQDTASKQKSTEQQLQDGLYLDATKARILGEKKQAESLLKSFIRTYPKVATPYYDLARLEMSEKQFDKAEAHLAEAIAIEGNNAWFKSEYAEALAYQDKFEKAAEVYEKLAKTETFNEDFLYKAAHFYQLAKKNDKALAMLDQMIAKTGGDETLLMEKQQIYLSMDRLDDALKVARKMIADNPKDPRFFVNLANLYDNNGKHDKAEEVLQEALQKFPDEAPLQLSLAEHYRLVKDFKKYDEYVVKAITNNTLDAEMQLSLLIPYLQANANDTEKTAKAEGMVNKLVAQHPESAQVLALYGQVLAIDGKLKEAAVYYKKSLAIEPSNFTVWQQFLYGFTDRQNADSLILYSEKAMRYYPNQATVHYLNGIGYLNKKEYPKAIKSINRAIDLQPEEDRRELAGMFTSLGDAYNETKQYKLSDSSYEKALRLDPLNATVLNNYAYYLSVRDERLKDAAEMSKKSLEIRPGEGTFLDTYGWILYKQGKFSEAKKYIDDAIKATPDADATLWDHIGDVEYKLNNKGAALNYWKKAKEKGSDNPKIDQKIADGKLYE